nr:AarF/UbiB family protein [Aneurinibacillus terranovensis]
MLRNRYYRIYVIVFMTVRFFFQVWWFNRKYRTGNRAELQEKWEQLVGRQAREYKQNALKLGGLLIKMGQFLSTRADVMPRAFTRELADLTDRVPSVQWEESRQVLEKELNQPVHEVFVDISDGPVASASIGEVYQAFLKTGEKVAIKIQRPGIEKIISADFAATRLVVSLARRFTRWGKMTDLKELYRQLEQTISRELDFRKEYVHAKRFMEMYANDSTVKIPRYYEEFMTRRILVMDWVEGAKVTDHRFLETHNIDKEYVVTRVARLFLEQVLQYGFFHADLHPGNIFICSAGTIVLLDFGMVGEIKPQSRMYIQQVIQAVILKDFDGVVDALDKLHFLTQQADREQVKIALQVGLELYFTRDFMTLDDDVLEEMILQLQDFVQVQPIQLPAEYAFLGRAFSTVIGVITTIKPDVDFLELGRPIVAEWLNQEETRTSNREVIVKLAKDVVREIVALPRQLNRYIDNSAEYRQYIRNRDEINKWLAYYRARQKTSLLFLVLGWGSAILLWVMHYSTETYICIGVMMIAFQRLLHYQKKAVNLLKERSTVN